MILEKPYFMTNESWYRFDEDKFKYVLTDEAPDEAIKSYKEFYELLESTTVIVVDEFRNS